MTDLEAAVSRALSQVPRDALQALADRLFDGSSAGAPAGPRTECLAAVADAAGSHPGGLAPAAAYLRGAADGYAQRAAEQRVELVWGGPTVHAVPTRALRQVLLDLINGADRSLLLMTYSARPHPAVMDALAAARGRGVDVTVVIETLAGAGSAISGDEPAAAFLGIPGIDLWHWPTPNRPSDSAKMHAKVAVADARVLLVGSANLTGSGIDHSMEAALLVTGGSAPRSVDKLVRELIANGELRRFR